MTGWNQAGDIEDWERELRDDSASWRASGWFVLGFYLCTTILVVAAVIEWRTLFVTVPATFVYAMAAPTLFGQ
jgi:hypothetical protein